MSRAQSNRPPPGCNSPLKGKPDSILIRLARFAGLFDFRDFAIPPVVRPDSHLLQTRRPRMNPERRFPRLNNFS